MTFVGAEEKKIKVGRQCVQAEMWWSVPKMAIPFKRVSWLRKKI